MSPQFKDPTAEAWRRGGSVETWSQIIRSRDALPSAFVAAASWLPADGPDFPYVVYAPRLAGTRRRIVERLVALAPEAIYVWERSGRQVDMTAYPLEMISAVEVGDVLLYSWLTITGLTSEGRAGVTTVEFNTVSQDCYRPLINRIRPAATNVSEAAFRVEQDKFNHLGALSFKFMNLSRASLLPGETVIDHLWQPQIRRSVFSVLGYSYHRLASVAHMTILTDQEIILLMEDERTARLKSGRYGSVRRYIPLERVAATSISRGTEELVALSFVLAPDDHPIEMLYDADKLDQIERFRAAVDAFITQRFAEGM